MNKIEIIKKEWLTSAREAVKNKSFKMIFDGQLGSKHYHQILKQVFLYYRNLPQLHASATAYFHGSQRKLIKDFYYYSIYKTDEIQSILNDLESIGEDIESIKVLNPLPSTMALTAFIFYQIQHNNPVSYLGNLFHNENIFRKYGKDFIFSFEKKGISRQNMSFLCEQAIEDSDQEHRVHQYLSELIKTNDDLDAVVYSARSSAYFFGQMIEQTVECTDQSTDWGNSYIEYDYINELKKDVPDQYLM